MYWNLNIRIHLYGIMWGDMMERTWFLLYYTYLIHMYTYYTFYLAAAGIADVFANIYCFVLDMRWYVVTFVWCYNFPLEFLTCWNNLFHYTRIIIIIIPLQWTWRPADYILSIKCKMAEPVSFLWNHIVLYSIISLLQYRGIVTILYRLLLWAFLIFQCLMT